MADDPAGGFGADTLDETRSEILFQRGAGGRSMLDGMGGLELPPIFGIDRPGAEKRHRGTGENTGLVDDDGRPTAGIVQRLDPQDRPAVVGIVVGDPVDDADETLGDGAGRGDDGRLHGR